MRHGACALDGGGAVGTTLNDQLLCGFGRLLVVEEDAGSGLGEEADAGGADAARASGDESNFAAEIEGETHEKLLQECGWSDFPTKPS